MKKRSVKLRSKSMILRSKSMKLRSKNVNKFSSICLILIMLLSISFNSIGVTAADFNDPKSVTAKWMISYMGRGTNLGNTYEMNMNPKDFNSVKRVVDQFIEAGYNNIRIPVNFGSRSDTNGIIDFNNQDLKTLKQIVEYIVNEVNPKRIAKGNSPVIVIVDTHHEEWAMHDLIGSDKYENNMKRLENIWKGISELFKDAPDTLIFEFFNEPHEEMGSGEKGKQSVIEMNKRLYNVIRSYTVAGEKPHQYRKLLFGGYNWNSVWGLMDTYKNAEDLPGEGKDQYIIGTCHFYNEIEIMEDNYNNVVKNFQEKYDIPVHLGEFGVNHKGNITEEVRAYYSTMANEAIKRNFAISVWDDNGWFQIYNRGAKTFNVLKDDTLGDKALPMPTKPSLIPGQVEAEDFREMNGIQTVACTDADGGWKVSDTNLGDWLDYDVNVKTAGKYMVEFRISGVNPTGTLQLQKDGTILATVTPPNTSEWQTVQASVLLSAGVQTLRLVSTGSQFDINWVKFIPDMPQATAPVIRPAGGIYDSARTVEMSCAIEGSTIRYTTDGSTPSESSPVYSEAIMLANTATVKAIAFVDGMMESKITNTAYKINIKHPVPGQIEVEGYSEMNGFETEPCLDVGEGINVGYTDPADWLDYTMNVRTSGSYTVELRMSAVDPTGTLQLQQNGAVLATIMPPNTGDWQKWETVKADFNLIAGEQNLRLYSDGSLFNINWFKLIRNVPQYMQQTATPILSPAGGTITSDQTVKIYTTPGSCVRYTTDGSTPNASSPIYREPIRVTENTTIKSFVTSPCMHDSSVATGTYTIN